jgi:hypothetical protein
MSADRLPGALLPLLYVVAVLVLSAAGAALMLRHERRHPSSYPGQREALEAASVTSMAEWRRRSTEEQEAADTAALDLAEQAALDAEDDAREAAAHLVQRAQANALFHP